jgi:hypothetical protein
MIRNMHDAAYENLLKKLENELTEFGFETSFEPKSEVNPMHILQVSVLAEGDEVEGEDEDLLEDEVITAQLFISEVPNSESPDYINLQLMIPVYMDFDFSADGEEVEDEDEDDSSLDVLFALPHVNNMVINGYFSTMLDKSIVFRATIPGLATEPFNPNIVNGVLDSAFFAVYEFGDILSALADGEIPLDEAMEMIFNMTEELSEEEDGE